MFHKTALHSPDCLSSTFNSSPFCRKKRMELKVYVEGVQRIVCGVTEKTTCQEVVIALARALGRTGRYTLRENFKDYERNVSPDERLLESLEKYGDQAKEVQLILKLIAPSSEEESRETHAQMRRSDGLGRGRKGSGTIGPLHRQSLPPLSRLSPHTEPLLEQPKQPKRKSLTLMEEAWGWLENLKRPDSGRDKEGNKGNGCLDNRYLKSTKAPLASRTPQMKEKREKNKSTQQKPLIRCLGNRGRCCSVYEDGEKQELKKGAKQDIKAINPVAPLVQSIPTKTEINESDELRRLVAQQEVSLKDLKEKIESSDQLILELERLQNSSQSPSEEEEQLKFWFNELKSEEVFEKELQNQFFQIKQAAAECKAKLEEYKQKIQTMDLKTLHQQRGQEYITHTANRDPPILVQTSQQIHISAKRLHEEGEKKRVITMLESKLPYVFVSANHLSSQSGPEDLREWWSWWSKSKHQIAQSKSKIVHRSEITIQLGSTRV